MQARRFKLTDNPEVTIALIQAVPSCFNVSGALLVAPQTAIDSGEAIRDTGVHLQTDGFLCVVARDMSNWKTATFLERAPVDHSALLFQGKKPGYFSVSAHVYKEQARNVLVELLRKFVQHGYRGRLKLEWFMRNDPHSSRIAGCIFSTEPGALNPYLGTRELEDARPAHVYLEWESLHGESDSHIAPVLAVCLERGLEEYGS